MTLRGFMPYPIHILDGPTRRPVPAVLDDDLPTAVLREIEDQWGRDRRRGYDRLRRAGHLDRVSHAHWRWDRKADGMAGGRHRLLGVRVGGEWQGAMSVHTTPVLARLWAWWRKALRALTRGGERPRAVYVDYLEVAPWNFSPFVDPDPPRYRAVGGQLIAAAVRASAAHGLGGRVGLNSLDTSEGFYRAIGMTPLGVDQSGPTAGLRYFEFSPEAAAAFVAQTPPTRRETKPND